MPHAPFVHLRVQSAYSMLESACQPKDIAKACRSLGFPAVALADRNSMFGAMEFTDACRSAGVQPIVGALIAVERPGAKSVQGRALTDWLVILAQDDAGYANLIALVSDAHLCGEGSSELSFQAVILAFQISGPLDGFTVLAFLGLVDP